MKVARQKASSVADTAEAIADVAKFVSVFQWVAIATRFIAIVSGASRSLEDLIKLHSELIELLSCG